MKKCVIALCVTGMMVMSLVGCGGSSSAAAPGTPKITVADSVAPQDDSLVPFNTTTAGLSNMEAVTITNSGSANLIIGQVASADPLAAPFSIALDTCSGTTLEPGASCDLIIRFAPLSSGLFVGGFDIPSNDPVTPSVPIGVSGTGTFGVPVPHIVVTDTVAPTDDKIVYFGTLNLDTAATQTVTIFNIGQVTLTIGTVGQANKLTGPFGMTDGCSGKSLAPSQSCTIGLEFHPNIAGPFSGGFDIPSNDPGGPVGVGVGGIGVDLISPSQVSFGVVAANTTHDRDVTITNNGAADLVIGTIANLDPLSAPFGIVSDPCSNATLSAGQSCTVTVEFAPPADGSYSDSFDIPTSGDVTGAFIVAVSGMSGTGTVSGTITLPGAPTAGTCYAVVLSTSINSADMMSSAVGFAIGQSDGSTTIAYSIPTVTPGQYYLFAGVDNDASSASPPACTFSAVTPSHGDFAGFYGGGYPAGPNVTVNVGSNTFDFSLTTYP